LSRRTGHRLIAVLLLTVIALAEEPLSEAERRGKQIYREGVSPADAEITAVFGPGKTRVQGSLMPCANCHGHDGKGRAEGGVIPSNITWPVLSKPYGNRYPDGRHAPAYEEKDLVRAIAMGLDSGGNALDDTMPRYALTRRDMADLIAYLRLLGETNDPGLTESAIRIGVVLPPEESLGTMAESVTAVLAARVAEINRKGGIYNRALDLRFRHASARPDARKAAYGALIEEARPFVLLAGFMAGDEADIAGLLETEQIPMIGAFTLYPHTGFPLNRHVFYIHSGLVEQSAALIRFAADQHETRPAIALISTDRDKQRRIAERLAARCRALGFARVETVVLDPARAALMLRELRLNGTEIVLALGGGRPALAVARQIEANGWSPMLLLPGVPLGPTGLANERVFTALPGLPPEKPTPEMEAYLHLAEEAGLPTAHGDAQLTALAALNLLVEGLTRVGHDLSRAALVDAVEDTYYFRTGMGPELSYGPNRRIGAAGAVVLRFDPDRKAWLKASDYLEPDAP